MCSSKGSSSQSLALCLLLLHSLIALQLAVTVSAEPAACPVQYSRHSLADIRSKARLPYLLGGIYDDSRACANCQRGGLWADFCSFKALGTSRFYDMQLCSSKTVDAVIDGALKQDNAADLLTVTPCDLWPFLKGRTTWIIGDSMSKDLYKALRCFLIEFQDLHTYHATDNFTAMHFLEAIPGKGEPRCVHMLDNARICQIHAIEGDLFVASERDSDRTSVGGVVPLIQQHLALPDDLFIVHFGLWHGETRQAAYKQYLKQLGQYYASSKAKFPHMFFMETPKQHFDSEDGDFKVPWIRTRKGPWTCQAIKGVTLNPDGTLDAEPGNSVAQYVTRGSWRNQLARQVLGRFGVPLIPVYNVTVPAWRFHRHNLQGQECSHFCHPSLPQFWLWHLLATFRQQRLQEVDNPWKQIPKAGCAIIYDWEERKYGNPRPAAAAAAGGGGNSSAAQGQQEGERQRGFWDWLRSQSSVVVKDGVVVPPPAAAAAAGGGSGGPKPKGQGGLTTWQVLQKLLDLKLLQQPQQQQQQSDKQSDKQAQDGQLKKDASAEQRAKHQQHQQRVQQEKMRKQQLEKGSRQQQPSQQQGREGAAKQQQQQQQGGGWEPGGDALVARHRQKKQQQQQGGAQAGHPAVVVQRQAGD